METKKLTATDLMVGDLVRQKHSGRVLRVSSFDPPYIREANELGQYKEDTIEPIPLTAEILEKNGWKMCKSNVWRRIKIGCDEININLGENYTQIEHLNMIYNPEDNAEVNYSSDFEYPRAIYVHELQHALRMCGIEKEVVI